MRRESDYHSSAYVRMCHKRNDDRKELIRKIKRADLIVVYLNIRHMEGLAGGKVSMAYRNGLMDAFRIVYGHDEAGILLNSLDKRRERMTRLITHMLRVKRGGKHKKKVTLGDVLKRRFTRETGIYITSEEHSIPESYETDSCEFFDGDVGEFLDRDDMRKFRELDSVLDCEIKFSGSDCLIYVTVFDNVFED